MKKTIIGPAASKRINAGDWLDLDSVSSVEVTSEDPAHPIEAALVDGILGGWRAGTPGTQVIRLSFAEPQRVRRVRIEIDERLVERTQELSLTCSSHGGEPREIVRQRWNFSPRGSTREEEEYAVDFHGVTTIELTLEPDVAKATAVASLTKLRVG
jgi:hypothetical protein